MMKLAILRHCRPCSVAFRRYLSSTQPARHVIQQEFSENKVIEYEFPIAARSGPISSRSVAQASTGSDLMGYLLPKNYPYSVGEGYLRYVHLQMASAFLSSAASVLSIQSMLSAVGLGVPGALPFMVTLNWILKDGLGQLGGIVFASFVNNRFDADPKKWRFLASCSLECSTFLELLTPLAPGYFLPMASLANIGKNISYLAASASRAAIHISFAKQHNLADITVKSGSQNIVSSMFGTGLGIGASYLLGDAFGGQVLVFSALSLSSLWMTYASLNCVTINTLNMTRLDRVFAQCLQSAHVVTPEEMKAEERFLGTMATMDLPDVTVGDHFHEVFQSEEEYEVSAAHAFLFCADGDAKGVEALLRGEKYLLNIVTYDKTAKVQVLLRTAASQRDLLSALCHAHVVRQMLRKEEYRTPTSSWWKRGKHVGERRQRLELLKASCQQLQAGKLL